MPEISRENRPSIEQGSLEQAADFLRDQEAKSREANRKFFPQQPDSTLADRAAEIAGHQETKPATPIEQDFELTSKAAADFYARFTGQELAEPDKINLMNEILAASQTGQISPHDQSVLLEQMSK